MAIVAHFFALKIAKKWPVWAKWVLSQATWVHGGTPWAVHSCETGHYRVSRAGEHADTGNRRLLPCV
jgi:thiosulfate reductase cytochrome b subunit